MPVKKLKYYLDANDIKYVVISHSSAFTALDVAESAHFSGNKLAKTVMVKMDGKMAMAVLPAPHKIDFELLKAICAAEQVELATEDEFTDLFPNCAVGTMPPFGNLYNMQVYLAEPLTENDEIAFAAGSHSELLKLSYRDFARLVKPAIVQFSLPR